jgi:S-adenosylmethionine decarboxylase
MMHFGEHVTIDGYGGKKELLDDEGLILRVLTELPREIGMKQLADPSVYRALPNDKKDPGGWTGFVVIQESHISIHTFPARGFVSADIYTCKNGLDVDFVVNYFKNIFQLQDVEQNFIKRGTRYPQDNIY